MAFGNHTLSREGAVSYDRERLGVLLKKLPIALCATLLNSSVMAAVLWPVAPKAQLLAWVVLQYLLSAGRLAVASLRFGNAAPSIRSAKAFAFFGSLLSGSLWGIGVAYFPPNLPQYELFAAFLVAGMCAGNITTSSSYFPSAIAFIVTAGIPLAVRFFATGGAPQLAMSALTIVFCGFLSVIAYAANRQFRQSHDLRSALVTRNSELSEANKSLEDEIASHARTETALRHAQKMEAIGQVGSSLAHDFNNILMVVGTMTDVLNREDLAATAKQKALSTIRESVKQGKAITHQLLSFARQQPLYPETVDLQELIARIEPVLIATLGPAIRLETSCAKDLWPAFIDPDQFERALINLAVNARDAMPAGGAMRIGATNAALSEGAVGDKQDDAVAVVVSDNGAGMTPEILSKAVQPFFTTKPSGQGTGLGLSQVYGMVTQSGGKVEITSEAGSGTLVRMILPRARS
ncbi:ATP-binding protein [Methylocapsa palsarum]|uniref:histidine kinase n=1 Tax=Methylocapsa palsarum TaxID=1612308 RepID=A0A1I3Z1Y2_9HYPH|nr:ATP-binding protein [Methylocapsa palsarum]SFK37997.1 Histidine kinase-, DNA gyrase B-, and HSP90-like ATPase [Methylocapsa palsarum]